MVQVVGLDGGNCLECETSPQQLLFRGQILDAALLHYFGQSGGVIDHSVGPGKAAVDEPLIGSRTKCVGVYPYFIRYYYYPDNYAEICRERNPLIESFHDSPLLCEFGKATALLRRPGMSRRCAFRCATQEEGNRSEADIPGDQQIGLDPAKSESKISS